ncbi:extracellular solute-binding protein [Alkalihalobacillus hwajinpoensis]|uniref:extracellular solute-binding protein n=1 Tax=Guptibacillus hwajinpoensis TaxID=208199 RepID=UPI001884353A|nr:extracellular solute-binding protein [Pseudalkalibacillus hwajinpoensis]MBF0708142.1 extracellular solute-binding protein [Pseudalkalibacillus hwajinpoensis]
MKRFFALFLTLVLAIGVLAACGPQNNENASSNNGGSDSEGEDANKPEKLVVWEDTDKGIALEPAIASFEEEYGIKVEFKELGMADEIREQIRLDGPAGTGPDVITLPHDQIGQAAVEGLISPIEVEQSVIDTFTESSIQAENFDGNLYGLPKATETPVFIYNKDLMDKAPESMDEVYDFAKDFTKDKQYGFLALWDNFYFANAVLSGYGGYVFDRTDEGLNPEDIGLNNDGAIEGTEYIQKWYQEDLFPKGLIGENGGSTMDGLFNEGKAASVMNGPWSFQGYKDAGIDIGVAPMPTLPNGENFKTFIGVKGWHVSNFSENKEWATKLVEWLTNEENAKIRYEKTAEIPPVKSLIEDPVIADNEGASAVALQSQYGVPMPNIPEMAEVWEPAASALQLVATDKQEPKAALDEATKTIKSQIEQNHSN